MPYDAQRLGRRGHVAEIAHAIEPQARLIGATGLEHRPMTDGQRVTGIYRRSVMLASERYVMLDNGMKFIPGAVASSD